jgi:hypothetical protein
MGMIRTAITILVDANNQRQEHVDLLSCRPMEGREGCHPLLKPVASV